MDKRCDKCKWFEISGTYLDKKWGRCLRFPPGRYWKDRKLVDSHNIVMEFDWCGEYAPKDDSKR